MSSPPPTKPPRGVKQGKETSGLLMSVIRTLSASETNEQREKERAKLEKEYKKSDARLDELVAEHAQDIMEVMQKFSAVGAALTAWGQHCDAAVGRLAACRGLLRLRRDDLRRLWSDVRTHHYAHEMLTDIESVVVSEREARSLLASGRVLGAATTLQQAIHTHDTTLSHVTALTSTRQHAEMKKQELVEVIVKNIGSAVYHAEQVPLSRRMSARRRTALLLAELTKNEEVTDSYLQDITPEFEASLAEEDKTFETTILISLEALGVLNQLTEATEKFKCQIQNELLEVINTVSRRVLDDPDVDLEGDEEDGETQDREGVTETGRPLARLVASLGEEFRACGARNKRLLQLWKAALQKYHIPDSCLHTEQHYWSAVQQVLQLLLTEYLEIESVTLAASRSNSIANPTSEAAPTELKLSDYFAKKRPQRRRPKFCKLSSPVHSSPSTVRPHRHPLVCKADPGHLHAILPTLHTLCADIESLRGGGECSLRAFITDYVRSGESERLARIARSDIEACMRASAAWRERQPVGSRLVFTCCVEGWQAVERTVTAVRRCGSTGGTHALMAVIVATRALSAHCRSAHSRLAPSHPAHSSRAARWLADDDIVRFLQALPNWRALTSNHSIPHQELKQAYEREAEILGTSLGDGAVTKREIIADMNALADLAVMCESMAWLSSKVNSIPSTMSGPSPSSASIKLNDKFHNEMSSAAMTFQDIANKCLLFLHLEMRIQCFHYLGQEGEGGAEGSDEEAGGAVQLASALLAAHDHTTRALPSHCRAYIFNGIGEMMSAAVVWRWQGSAQGVAGAEARLGTLRHCLAALHLPHDGLHRAHHYLHLLTCSHEEIIKSIREKGAQFSELEYLNAFKVIGASRGVSPADMKVQLQRLSAALGHVGVTV